MLTIKIAKEYKDFGKKKIAGKNIFDTCKSTIDMANALDELVEKINNDEDVEIITLSKFVLTRVGILICKNYINSRSNVVIKLYSDEGSKIEDYVYNKDGSVNGLNMAIFSPSIKSYKFKK